MKRKLTKSVALGVVILAMAACTSKKHPIQKPPVAKTEHAPNNAKTNVITTTVKTKKK